MSPYSSNNESLTNINFPIECRMGLKWWGVVVIGLVMSVGSIAAGFMLPITKPSDKNGFIVMTTLGALFGLVTLWLALETLLSVVRADENGLTWRRPFFGWNQARWDEITDYYRSSPVRRTGMVETRNGRVELAHEFDGIERIADLVIAKTPHIATSGWEMKGTRSNDNWSRTFKTFTYESLGSPLFTIGTVWAGFAYAAVMIMQMNSRRPILPFLANNTDVLIIVLVVAVPMVGLTVWRTHQVLRDWWFDMKRRDEKLVLDAKGLVFTSRERNHEVEWREITRISLLPKVHGRTPVEVETSEERFIIWYIGHLTIWPKIKLILEQYADQALRNGASRS